MIYSSVCPERPGSWFSKRQRRNVDGKRIFRQGLNSSCMSSSVRLHGSDKHRSTLSLPMPLGSYQHTLPDPPPRPRPPRASML